MFAILLQEYQELRPNRNRLSPKTCRTTRLALRFQASLCRSSLPTSLACRQVLSPSALCVLWRQNQAALICLLGLGCIARPSLPPFPPLTASAHPPQRP